MHIINITPNLLFEYQCTSGKFIRLPNQIEKIDLVGRIESKRFLPELECFTDRQKKYTYPTTLTPPDTLTHYSLHLTYRQTDCITTIASCCHYNSRVSNVTLTTKAANLVPLIRLHLPTALLQQQNRTCL